MDVKAVGNFIVLERLEAPRMVGGIEIPELTREQMSQRPIGVVVSVGPLVNHVEPASTFAEAPEHPDPIREGDVVLFCGDLARGVHGADGLPLWFCTREDVAGRVTGDKPASAEQARALNDRHARIRGELAERQEQERRRASIVADAGLAAQAGAAGMKLVE